LGPGPPFNNNISWSRVFVGCARDFGPARNSRGRRAHDARTRDRRKVVGDMLAVAKIISQSVSRCARVVAQCQKSFARAQNICAELSTSCRDIARILSGPRVGARKISRVRGARAEAERNVRGVRAKYLRVCRQCRQCWRSMTTMSRRSRDIVVIKILSETI
jgi:hypothetical protein